MSLQKNSKVTALEILQAVGTTFQVGEQQLKPIEVFGKVRVRIAGIVGIVKPDHLIRIQDSDGDGKIDIVVGNEKYQVPVAESGDEAVVSEPARKVLDQRAPAEEPAEPAE